MAEPSSHSEQKFFGRFEVPVEESGRFLLPFKWRLEMPEAKFGLIVWPIKASTHLLGLPSWLWDKFLKHLIDDPPEEEVMFHCERAIGEGADEVELDKIGRITVRKELLERVGVKKECVLIGRVSKWELWSPERYREIGKISEEDTGTAASHYKKLRL